jgi:hypothetical protein
MKLDVIFRNLEREQVAELLALTKDLGHERLVTSAGESDGADEEAG